MEGKTINRLIKLLGSCHLEDVASIRRLYSGDNMYHYDGVSVECGEIHKTTPEYVKFTLGFTLGMLGLDFCDRQLDTMTADYCFRDFVIQTETISLLKEHATGKEKFTGKIYIHNPNQKILPRTSAYISGGVLYISLTVRFPVLMASKRTVINGGPSVNIIRKELCRAIRNFIRYFDVKEYKKNAAVYRRQKEIRKMLGEKGLVSFLANGSILPRSDRGLALRGAVPFVSPPEDEIEMRFPDGYAIKGMGIKAGVTVITGGGYSGKSTLLDAILHGIYDHIPGDGREYCITKQNVCKILAEDGRSVSSLDISPFIRNVDNLNTDRFTTRHASGSTSQAANIMEAIAYGCGAFLIDEDRTATNFMIRDARMKKIIRDDPIVPFTDRVRQIYEDTKISTVLIIGGSSEYLDLADNVYIMKEFRICNYNREVAATRQNTFDFYTADKEPVRWKTDRKIIKKPMMAFKKDEESDRIREYAAVTEEEIAVGVYRANVSKLETVVSRQQMAAIAFIIRRMFNKKENELCLLDEIGGIYGEILENGFGELYSGSFGIDFNLELPAMHDILFTLARMDDIAYDEAVNFAPISKIIE